MKEDKHESFKELLESQFQTKDAMWNRIKTMLAKADPMTAVHIMVQLNHHLVDIMQGLSQDSNDRVKDADDLLNRITEP